MRKSNRMEWQNVRKKPEKSFNYKLFDNDY